MEYSWCLYNITSWASFALNFIFIFIFVSVSTRTSIYWFLMCSIRLVLVFNTLTDWTINCGRKPVDSSDIVDRAFCRFYNSTYLSVNIINLLDLWFTSILWRRLIHLLNLNLFHLIKLLLCLPLFIWSFSHIHQFLNSDTLVQLLLLLFYILTHYIIPFSWFSIWWGAIWSTLIILSWDYSRVSQSSHD